MDIIFDDSFRFLSNFQKQEDEVPTRISSLGSVIIERNIRLAVSAHVVSEWERYKRSSAIDRQTILKDILTDASIIQADKTWFRERVETMSGEGSRRGGWSAEDEDIQKLLMNDSDLAGQPGADISAPLKLKEAVIARMRMRGKSDQEINDVLVLFMEKVMLPFSETIKILDYCLEESMKARVDFMDLVEFWAYHYKEKRSQSLTKSIVDQAVKLQELNPTLNIFNLLKNAAIGNQTEVSKVILIKDPDARLVVNNLISLSQSALPEQAEQVRRNFQFSRDALLNYQEKLNIQKALYDMMKTEEMNRNVSSFIADTSAIFKALLTQPIFRAMRDVYYDLQASKILLNTYYSLVVDTRPVTPRVTPTEEQLSPGEGMFPYQEKPQRISSTKFRPLKKNNVIVAQANQSPGSLATSTMPITGGQSFVGLPQQPQSQPGLGYATAPVQSQNTPAQQKNNPTAAAQIVSTLSKEIQEALSALGAPFVIIGNIIGKAFEKLVNSIRSGVTNILGMIEQVFKEIFDNMRNMWKTISDAFANYVVKPVSNALNAAGKKASEFLGTSPGKKSTAHHLDNFVKLAQYNPQLSAAGFDTQMWLASISGVVAVLVIALGARGVASAFRALVRANDFKTIVDLIGPAFLYVKNFLIEMWQSFTTIGWGNLAPTSAEYYNPTTRQFSPEGLRRLYNNQQVRIALGISNAEDLALSRAQKQRAENMAAVRTQTDILQKYMDQNVYLGGKSDVAPGAVPLDLQNKINVFLKFVESVQNGNQAEYLILKKAIDRVYMKLDPMQKVQAQNLLSEIRNDIAVLQSLKSEYSSSALVMDHIQRKRKLVMKLGPSLKRLEALESLGISKAALITGKNGVLQQLSRIRHEEASALQKLRKEYMEKMQLLDRPDIAQREFALPTNTTSIRLPVPPLPPTTPTSV